MTRQGGDDTAETHAPAPARESAYAARRFRLPPKSARLLREAEEALKAGRFDEAAAKAGRRPSGKGWRGAPGPDQRKARERKAAEEKAARENRQREDEEAREKDGRSGRIMTPRSRSWNSPTTEVEPLVAANRWDAALARFDTAERPTRRFDPSPIFSRPGRGSRITGTTRRDRSRRPLRRRGRGSRRANTESPPAWRSRPGRSTRRSRRAPRSSSRSRADARFETRPGLRHHQGGVKLGDARQPDEPERVYTSRGFLMDVTEVTNEEYFLFVSRPATGRPSIPSGPDGISGPAWNSCP